MSTYRSYVKQSRSINEKSKGYLTKEIDFNKRQHALGDIQDSTKSLQIMRQKYKQSDWYERKELEKNAETLKQRIKSKTTQYKIYVKKTVGETGKDVVDALF